MKKETKIALLLDEYNEKKEEIKNSYDDNYAAADMTPEKTIELKMWSVEENNKLEKWFIKSIKDIFNQ